MRRGEVRVEMVEMDGGKGGGVKAGAGTQDIAGIDAGVLVDQTDAAAKLGLTKARVPQLMDLTLLPAKKQKEIRTRNNSYMLKLLGLFFAVISLGLWKCCLDLRAHPRFWMVTPSCMFGSSIPNPVYYPTLPTNLRELPTS